MGFKNMKRDDQGHVISNDETDGQKCQHGTGKSAAPEQTRDEGKASNLLNRIEEATGKDIAKLEDEINVAYNQGQINEQEHTILLNKLFDADYEEEFEDKPAPVKGDKFSVEGRTFQVTNVDRDGNHIVAKDLKTGEEFDWTKDRLINDESFRFEDVFDDEFEDESQEEYEARIKPEAEKFKKQLNDAGYKLKDKEYGLEDAIKNADDDVLDDYFGKDSPERKLAGAIKEGKPEDFAKKTAKMPNGKEMSLFDFAHNIVNYLDTDTASAIIAAKFGVSENNAKAYLESPYNTEGNYKEKLNASNKKQKYKEVNGMIYPVGPDGKIDKDNKFPNLKAFKDVYGENVEEDK